MVNDDKSSWALWNRFQTLRLAVNGLSAHFIALVAMIECHYLLLCWTRRLIISGCVYRKTKPIIARMPDLWPLAMTFQVTYTLRKHWLKPTHWMKTDSPVKLTYVRRKGNDMLHKTNHKTRHYCREYLIFDFMLRNLVQRAWNGEGLWPKQLLKYLSATRSIWTWRGRQRRETTSIWLKEKCR